MVVQARLGAGEWALIHAAGSGVGTAAAQIARAIGARVIGTARTRDKLDSYRVLAEALALLKHKPWQALLVGDGPARLELK